MNKHDCWAAVHECIARGDVEQAVKICEKEPCAGVLECQRFLGWDFYKKGELDHALGWFEKASCHDDGEVEFGIASIKFSRKDFKSSLYHFERAAARGFTRALHWIGYIHHQGLGVPKNLDLAVDYYKQSAANGYLVAERALLHLAWKNGSFLARIVAVPRFVVIAIRAFTIAGRNPYDPRIADVPNALENGENVGSK